MSQPVPEERNDAEDLQPGDVPPGEHAGELPDEADADAGPDAGPDAGSASEQAENAGSSQDQPSQ